MEGADSSEGARTGESDALVMGLSSMLLCASCILRSSDSMFHGKSWHDSNEEALPWRCCGISVAVMDTNNWDWGLGCCWPLLSEGEEYASDGRGGGSQCVVFVLWST